MNNRKGSGRKTKHHDREEAGHEHTCCFVTCEETMQVAMNYLTGCISKVADLEPYDRVDDMVQTKRNQQAVSDDMDSRTDTSQAGNPVAKDIQRVLNRAPNQAENQPDNNHRYRGNHGNKTFAAEEP
ncbi:hypothetical protein D3C81_1248400 [compost metagenome]